jgi:YVTN family beta-propeller protein
MCTVNTNRRLPLRWLALIGAVTMVVLMGAGAVLATVSPQLVAGPRPDGTGVNSHGRVLTPAGRQVQLGDRPYGMALSPDGRTLLVSNNGQSTQSLMVVDSASGTLRQTIPYRSPEALFIGVAFSPDGARAYASAGGNNKIRVYDVVGQTLTERDPIPLPTSGPPPQGQRINPYPAGLAVSGDGRTLYVVDNLADAVSIVDVPGSAVRATVPVGHNPYTIVLSPDGGSVAYVSNWGEQTVSALDTTTAAVQQTINVGTHPSALAINPRRDELYVANSDSNTISVISTSTNRVLRSIDLAPYEGAPTGSSPNALTVSPDGGTLYVANAETNDVAVIRLAGGDWNDDDRRTQHRTARQGRRHEPGSDDTDEIAGLIPTAWYPAALALDRHGKTLFVANAKGLGAGPNPGGPNLYRPSTPPDQYVGSMMTGTLSIIDVPNEDQLSRYTEQVARNNRFEDQRSGRDGDEQVIPRRPGGASPIKRVIYVVKENRTYDQVFGSLGKGNGDPSLNLFGDESAPNHRELARRFVTLDNFYADSEVSADGWSWSTAAMANTYVQKTWPANYSGRNRPYDFEGGNLATTPNAEPTNAYLWDRLSRASIEYRNYGFWASGTVPAQVAATAPELAARTDLAFPGYNMAIRDQIRVDEWLREFRGFEARGTLPTVELVRLPTDHTSGTRPGAPTPRAMVADNDLALGRLVEAVSRSRFWKDTAIFVVEDDAQNGPDHVDAHRTLALVISPYTQLGKVDSTFYSTVSMLRTMELIVGIAPMTQFDAAATPMLASFSDRPNLRPYTSITPTQSLDELNGASAPMAAESLAMDFSSEDLADAQLLNAAIWKSVNGADSEMPTPVTGSLAAAWAG